MRSIIQFASIVLMSLAGCFVDSPSVTADERPNFLFIYADDHRYDALSVVQTEQGERGRFPWFETPNMDRIAKEGIRFRNAFVVSSLCAPSRAAFLTGRYNHLNGIASNFRPFPLDSVTHATILRQNGYKTGYIGKWHMDSQRERPGFDYHASYIGHARYVDPTFIVNGVDVPKSGWIDDIATDYAIDFMKGEAASEKPWSLVVGFKSPHGPFTPPERASERFTDKKARAVPNLASPAPYSKRSLNRTEQVDKNATEVPASLEYMRCISGIDDCVGRLLNTLDELKLADNTIVIYTSDNGFYLGEHGLGDKRSAYDESLRIPFLVRLPKRMQALESRLVDDMVLNIDLAPTLLDFAGIPVPPTMQGKSWKSLVTPTKSDSNTPFRESWLYEYFAEKQRSSDVPDITAVRTKNAKLILYSGHPEWSELFDLSRDPFETVNLFNKPEAIELQKQLESEHATLLKETDYRVPQYVDRPEWWERGTPDPIPQVVLDFDFQNDSENTARDRSSQKNDGKIIGTQLVREGDKILGRQFGDKGHIQIDKSPSLSPMDSPWAIEIECTPSGEGTLVARGGVQAGYVVFIQAGKLQLRFNSAGKSYDLSTPFDVVDKRVKIGAKLTQEKKLRILIDNKVVAERTVPDWIDRDPMDSLQIGADLGSPVAPNPKNFNGIIHRVRIARVDFAD